MNACKLTFDASARDLTVGMMGEVLVGASTLLYLQYTYMPPTGRYVVANSLLYLHFLVKGTAATRPTSVINQQLPSKTNTLLYLTCSRWNFLVHNPGTDAFILQLGMKEYVSRA
jgi:hypothetical protein